MFVAHDSQEVTNHQSCRKPSIEILRKASIDIQPRNSVEAIHKFEEIHTDLSLQLKQKEYVYIPRDWVYTKLDQIKTESTLGIETTVFSDSVQISGNKITMSIRTYMDKIANFELLFFQDGIIKLNCVNPYNPSKFSLELVDKPANLATYSVEGKVLKDTEHFEVNMPETKTKLVVRFDTFSLQVLSTRNSTEEVILTFNGKKSLLFDENLAGDFVFGTEYLYGLPERAANFLLEDTKADLPYRFYNQDVPCYPVGSKNALYATVPIIFSRSKDSPSLVSIYWQNASDTYIDIHRDGSNTSAYWLSERGNLDCYLFVSPSIKTHFKSFASVMGHCAMPQYFSLGYHQCRWSYDDQKDLLGVNTGFNKYDIPCDTLTLDIDYSDGCRYFTWNEDLFPDPLGMQETLVKDGRELVTIADPHIKLDAEYSLYREAADRELYVKTKDREAFIGVCWPGKSIYLDFLNEECRNLWASYYGYDKYSKSTPHVWAWNDMNEPSVFELQGNHMPLDNIQTFKSLSEPEKTFEVEHREVHNLYGYLQHKATYDGMVKRNADQNIRPHVLSRSFYAGSQKYTTIWTGDTGASWDYLKVTVPQLLSLSMCGISFCGGDVGGFMGDPEVELAIRWYQLGTYMPYFRGHSEKTTKRREPWLYEKKYSEIIKESIKERYRLLPYWYSCFEEHCRTLEPVVRPIWYAQDKVFDEEIMAEQERFMVGEALLVVPILEKGKRAIQGFLKGLEGRFYDLLTYREVTQEEDLKTGIERIGCFVKGGNIVPTFDLAKGVKSSKDAKLSNMQLYVALDEKETAKGGIYFDDGETFDYKKGLYMRKSFEFSKNVLTWEGEERPGYTVPNKVTRMIVTGSSIKYESAYLEESGTRQEIKLERHAGYVIVEFEASAAKNFKICLE